MTVKAVDVAAYILRRKGPLEAIKLQKLVYYSQCHSLVVRGQPLFHDPIQAWKNGPVTPAVWEHHRWAVVVEPGRIPGNPDALDPADQSGVDAMIEKYSGFRAFELSDKTHQEAPWKDARPGLRDNAWCDSEISHASMQRYYASAPDWLESNMVEKNNFTGTPDNTDRAMLTNILRNGLQQNMSRSAILDSVARQVASSQRLEGVEVTNSDVRRILDGRPST